MIKTIAFFLLFAGAVNAATLRIDIIVLNNAGDTTNRIDSVTFGRAATDRIQAVFGNRIAGDIRRLIRDTVRDAEIRELQDAARRQADEAAAALEDVE